ncbi:MAG: hypothetical protein Q8P90_00250 [bacterium]|nr:hypothetical protein [bacterium]
MILLFDWVIFGNQQTNTQHVQVVTSDNNTDSMITIDLTEGLNMDRGINIGHQDFIKAFSKIDNVNLEFIEHERIEDKENFIAEINNAQIQLIGPDNNVQTAVFSFYNSDNNEDNTASLVIAEDFITVVEPKYTSEILIWFLQQIQQDYDTNGEYISNYSINGKDYNFHMTKLLEKYSLEIKASYQK